MTATTHDTTTRLQRLYHDHGQSPWLDNLTRPKLRDGTLAGLVSSGIRGVTANPTIFAKAIQGSDAYDQFGSLIAAGYSAPDAYWELVIDDIAQALAVLRPTFDVRHQRSRRRPDRRIDVRRVRVGRGGTRTRRPPRLSVPGDAPR